MGDGLSVMQLYNLVVDYYGNKASVPSFNPEGKRVHCTLYETYPLTCSIDDLDRFGANIGLDRRTATGEFFGKSTSLNSTAGAITESLGIIDDWCRLHLPDKFLVKFDAMQGLA